MMSTQPAAHGGDLVPGLRIEARRRPRTLSLAADSAVPAFLGVGAERSGWSRDRRSARQGIECRSLDDFDRAVRPAPGGFLRDAARGFFANGGVRCVVLLAPESDGKALRQLLEPGAPLCDRDDIDLICIPDASSAAPGCADQLQSLQALQIEHCQRMGDRFAILDAPASFEGFRNAGLAASSVTVPQLPFGLRSEFGAMYFPWVSSSAETVRAIRHGEMEWRRRQPQQTRSACVRMVPPCGHVAGLYARMDAQVGMHRAPANQAMEDALDVSHAVTAQEQSMLADARINCLVRVRARGVLVGGARTLSGHDRWAYVSTARVVIGFRRWLGHGMADIAFEPNTPALQERIHQRLLEQCLSLWRAGALVGDTASQAFSVKCDSELNTEAMREQGLVVAEVGLAPSVPAEFIEVRVVYDANDIAINRA